MATPNTPYGTTAEIQDQIRANVDSLFDRTNAPFGEQPRFLIYILKSAIPGWPYVASVSHGIEEIFMQGPRRNTAKAALVSLLETSAEALHQQMGRKMLAQHHPGVFQTVNGGLYKYP